MLPRSAAQNGFDGHRYRRVLGSGGTLDMYAVSDGGDRLFGQRKTTRESGARLTAGFAGPLPQRIRTVILAVPDLFVVTPDNVGRICPHFGVVGMS
jgi:hypothetical protein